MIPQKSKIFGSRKSKDFLGNKKAQAESIIIFFILFVAIFAVSIIVLRIVNSVLTPFSSAIGNVSAPAGAAVAYAQNRFTTWWDYAILLIFLVNVILLLISSFLVDIHPAFLIVYIISIIFLFIFGNYALSALDSIWYYAGTSVETAQTPIQQFVLNHFQAIMIGIIILSGIVMYSKMKWFGNVGAGGGGY